MKMRLFKDIDSSYPERTSDQNDSGYHYIGELNHKEYVDFLAQDGRSIRIRMIRPIPTQHTIMIYYDDLKQVAGKEEIMDRFSMLDVSTDDEGV